MDECASNPCQNQGTCIDRRGMFVCNCPDGYHGDACELRSCNSQDCRARQSLDSRSNHYVVFHSIPFHSIPFHCYNRLQLQPLTEMSRELPSGVYRVSPGNHTWQKLKLPHLEIPVRVFQACMHGKRAERSKNKIDYAYLLLNKNFVHFINAKSARRISGHNLHVFMQAQIPAKLFMFENFRKGNDSISSLLIIK